METRRFASLDGLRGICAAIVLLFHAFRFQKSNPFAHGFLSVDIFFLLSGFVLAFAFGDRLAAGMSPARFMRARIHRLGPVLWFGAVFSVLGCLVADRFSPSHVPFYAVLVAGLQNAFLIPMFGTSTIDTFPLNGPSWSLFAEIWINAGFALLATRLTPTMLAAIVAGGWAFLTFHVLRIGTADFGATQATIFYAIPRSIPSFAAGVLIFKLWRKGALARLPSIPPVMAFALWTMVALLPTKNPVFDLIQIMVTAPLLLALLAKTSQETPAWCLWLGRLSYPLYATHAIIITAGQRIVGGRLSLWTITLLCVLSLLLADILARWVEPAIRRGLRGDAGAEPASDLVDDLESPPALEHFSEQTG